MHILTIKQLQAGEYLGSKLRIEKTFKEEEKYIAYLASYQSEGLKIYGYLTIPKTEKPANGYPVIIFNRGYIDLKEYKTEWQYTRYVHFLASSGYIVFKSDYRGAGESEGEVENLMESGFAIDVLNGVASIKTLPEVDQKRIGVWGHSLGGDVSLKVILASKDIKAAVVWSAPLMPYDQSLKRWYDPKVLETLKPEEKEKRLEMLDKMVAKFGDPNTNPENYQEISPISHVKEINIPIEIHHGLLDDRVPVTNSENLHQALEALGKQTKLHLYKDGDHNLSGKELKEAMEKSIKFFNKYLKD